MANDGRFDAANMRRMREAEDRRRREALLEMVDKAETVDDLKAVLRTIIVRSK